MIVIEKDRHMTIKKPFFQAHVDYNKWFLSQDFNTEENTFIQTGDLFHTSIPTPEEIDEMIRFFSETKFKKIYILAGNHDRSDTLKTFSILPLKNNSRVELVFEPTQVDIEGKKFFLMPHYTDLDKFPPMKEYYSAVPEELNNNDYLVYHFDDETIQFGKHKTGINISYLKGKRIGGHIHKSQKNYELGMPVTSRFDEKGQTNTLMLIGKSDTFVMIPKFIEYEDVNYPEDLPSSQAKYPIWDIHNSISGRVARQFYKEKYPSISIREVHVKNEKDDSIERTAKNTSVKTTMDFFNNYINGRPDLGDWVKDRLRTIISKRN